MQMGARTEHADSVLTVPQLWWQMPWIQKQEPEQEACAVIFLQLGMHLEEPESHKQRSPSAEQESEVGRFQHGPSHLLVAASQAQPSPGFCVQLAESVPVQVLGPQLPSS